MPEEAAYRHLVKAIALRSGKQAAVFFQQLYHLARTKQPCDVCLTGGTVSEGITIGADFIYALEFEAPVETVVQMLSRVKIVAGGVTPVVTIALEDVNAVISMPRIEITGEEMLASNAREQLAEKGSSGETLEAFILRTYQPKTAEELERYAARYLVALRRKDEP